MGTRPTRQDAITTEAVALAAEARERPRNSASRTSYLVAEVDTLEAARSALRLRRGSLTNSVHRSLDAMARREVQS